MRSRYTAYVTGAIDHVLASHHPSTRDSVDREGAESWSSEAEWDGLEVVDTEAGGEGDSEGVVEFIARYRAQGQPISHRERARFVHEDGQWFYVDGDIVKNKPTRREAPKVGRNEPCPCGSGKKYKKCHGAAA